MKKTQHALLFFCFVITLGISSQATSQNCPPSPSLPGDYTPLPTVDPCNANAVSIKYNPDNPQQVQTGTSITISVLNGVGPFHWSVSGGDFTLDDGSNTGGAISSNQSSITLTAGSNSCGNTAQITITDDCGNEASGSVTNTSSIGWVLVNNYSFDPAYAKPAEITGVNVTRIDAVNGDWHMEEITANFKVEESYTNIVTTNYACKGDLLPADPFSITKFDCSSLCDENPEICDFWLLNNCDAYYGQTVNNNDLLPCCDSQCLQIQDRFVYQKSCQ